MVLPAGYRDGVIVGKDAQPLIRTAPPRPDERVRHLHAKKAPCKERKHGIAGKRAG